MPDELNESPQPSKKDLSLDSNQNPIDTSNTESNQQSILRDVLEKRLDHAKELESSENESVKDAYKRAEKRVLEVQQYEKDKIITSDEAFRIIVSLIADNEINGLKDPKTDLLNENGFNERLAALISHARRGREQLVLSYFDLVGFKDINDILGHEKGDRIFIYFRDYVREKLGIRPEDPFARLGGDEFVIAFPNGAEESIRERFNGEHITTEFSDYVKERMTNDGIDYQNLIVTARVGITALQEEDTVKTLKDRADQEMNAQRNSSQKTTR